jgi:hypothetical protein
MPDVKIFSTATNTIDAAIMGSTISPGAETRPVTAAASVIVWASVKAVTCQSKARRVGERKKRAKTNRMWSSPLGII